VQTFPLKAPLVMGIDANRRVANLSLIARSGGRLVTIIRNRFAARWVRR